jgi:peroxiredoxin
MMVVIGLLFVLAGFLAYLMLLFVLRRFTYRTWMFDSFVGAGTILAIIGWAIGGSSMAALTAVLLGGGWFFVSRRELRLVGSEQLRLRKGDHIPSFTVLTTDGRQITEHDLIARAPALLVLYRGWWCPSSKSQLDALYHGYERLRQSGLTIFAGSVDGPDEAIPLQQRVGDKITILCNVSESLLDEVGVRDQRGAPWYDRILYGAARQDISMPAALCIDASGRITFAYRSTRLDHWVRVADMLLFSRQSEEADSSRKGP